MRKLSAAHTVIYRQCCWHLCDCKNNNTVCDQYVGSIFIVCPWTQCVQPPVASIKRIAAVTATTCSPSTRQLTYRAFPYKRRSSAYLMLIHHRIPQTKVRMSQTYSREGTSSQARRQQNSPTGAVVDDRSHDRASRANAKWREEHEEALRAHKKQQESAEKEAAKKGSGWGCCNPQ